MQEQGTQAHAQRTIGILTHSPENGGWRITESYTCKTEIANLQLAVSVSENVLRLQVSVEDISCGESKTRQL